MDIATTETDVDAAAAAVDLSSVHSRKTGTSGRLESLVKQSLFRWTQFRHFGYSASHFTFRRRHSLHAIDRRARFVGGGSAILLAERRRAPLLTSNKLDS